MMVVTATGGGKTVLFCNIVAELDRPTCLISHRQELVGQAALALNREQVPHGIIAPPAIQRQIIALEQETFGRSFYSPRAAARVAGIDTLINHDTADPWFKQVELFVGDEGHHFANENKWVKGASMLPNARGLLVTAHALRADGKGLGRGPNGDGIVDELVVGPCGRELIDRGFLCDYRLVCPPLDVHFDDIEIGATGDMKYDQVRARVHSSKTIVGDIVEHYLKFAGGKLGITFAVDIEAATEIAAKYRSRNVRAEIITAKTPLAVRGQLMRMFRARDILQLVSVDVLGEGVDVPAVEVVSMGRPTASFQLYGQQFGRSLRMMLTDEQNRTWNDRTDAQRLAEIAASVKPKAIVIDHVENYRRHGLPDVKRKYDLNRAPRKKKRSNDEIPLRYCINPECLEPYETTLSKCPHCGTPKPAPMARGTPAEVEGDCMELDPAVLHEMRLEQALIDGPAPKAPPGADRIVTLAIHKRHNERFDTQQEMRRAMGVWCNWQHLQGRDPAEVRRRFWYRFGVDTLSAQALGTREAEALREQIAAELEANSVTEAV